MMPAQNNAPSMEEWMKFQQNMNVTMHDLKMQIGQLANLSAGSRNLPSQPILNPKGGKVSAVTLRSGKELHVAPQPKSTPTKAETEKEADSQVQQQARPILLPFSSRTISAKKLETDEDLLKMFRRVPKYAKVLKELCMHKRNKLKGGAEVGGVLSTFIQNNNTARTQQALPQKCKDPRIFLIPCTIGGCTFDDAMLDLGASINVMPALVYKSLNFGDLEPTGVVIQLANRSVVQPVGILEDVLVQLNDLIFPTDFYLLEMEDETSGKRVNFNSWTAISDDGKDED
ncbi:hypothetical protein CR513_34509, partial [Mucuna pruriens]